MSVFDRTTRKGLGLVAGFWLVILALVGTRVALFDDIAAARASDWAATQMARLSDVVTR